ncbi:adenosylcobalamin-dependent ribonucleoside-diphosphate reductase [Candidatus Pacearchaeota archaeon]|nr:adenosylcobalamin-dependent ribonucleoside-diphosphate reductase [Candidatus Pacearchaeota archaeon]
MVGRQVYSHEEAVRRSIEYFNGDRLAGETVVNKYLLKDSKGNIYESSPIDMHRRLAREFARIESKYPNPMSEEKIFSLLDKFKYIVPQGSPQSGIGNDYQVVSLSNCFVIGNESDSYGGIIRTDEEQVQLMKRRGGVGQDLSHLRPKKSAVANSALNSTGMATFMNRYSESTREVAQDGRRGALMLSAAIRHPDAEYFIDAKTTPGKVTGANISVRIDDEFMNAAIKDKKYVQQFPVNSENPSIKKEINARDLWKKIVHNAWTSAEPGILFWDTIIRESVPDSYADEGFKTVSTNPCGEIPLCVYDSCRLLAMNLYNYVDNPFTKDAKFNHALFKEHARHGQRLMDDLIDLELEKIDKIIAKIDSDPEDEDIKYVEKNLWEKIKKKAEQGRRTGFGVTSEGDMLAALGMRYGSDEAIEFSANTVHKTLALEAYRSSVNMAEERGAFPIYNSSKEEKNPFINRIREADPELYAKMTKHGRRNIALLTIAPTGSVSIETQTTSGLENAFSVAYMRKRKINPNDKNVRVDSVDGVGDSWQHYSVLHHKFVTWMEINGYDVEEVKRIADQSFQEIPERRQRMQELEQIIQKSPYHNATAKDVDWVSKIKLQGAVQKWVDHSISVTVNLPEDIPEEMVGKVYEEAWREGCKGVTVYRAGSRDGVLISNDNGKKEIGRKELSDLVMGVINRKRPDNIQGRPEEVITPYENSVFVTLNWEKDEKGNIVAPYESFVAIGKAGEDLPAIAEGYGRLTSLALKAGVTVEKIISQLRGIGGASQKGFGENKVTSLPDAIAKGFETILEKERRYGNLKSDGNSNNGIKASGNFCPEGHPTIFEEGCEKCPTCGFSKC